MKRIILGTAGHIDHGKTTLVKALTGVETDRLKEEKQRGITIELGFAPFKLPSGQKAAIVDVPGHERFIKHMLAGAFGIDMVLFVIAADEGVMPQSREHMDIIELLGVEKGIIVITKKDLVDEEWLMLLEDEIQQFINKSILKGAPIVFVSAHTGEGIDELIAKIEELSEGIKEKPILGNSRIPVDRAFSMPGFGTVATGTLWSGQFSVGDQLEILPIKKEVKIRTLQVHNEKVQTAYAGQRVAVNLQGTDLAELKRGYVLASPGYLNPSYRVDTKLRLLSSSPRSLKNWNRIRFHLGTDESLGRIVLLDRDEIHAGEEAYAQIVLEKPIVAYKGDPFVIRYYSPVSTIGGGTIIDANAPKQKRFKEDVLDELVMKEEGSLYDILLFELEESAEQVFNLEELEKESGASKDVLIEEMKKLANDKKVIQINEQPALFISAYGMESIFMKIDNTLDTYHQKYPLRIGYPREDIRSRYFSHIPAKIFQAVIKHLEKQEKIIAQSNFIKLTGFEAKPSEKQVVMIENIKRNLIDHEFSPPSIEELREKLGINQAEFDEMISYLSEKNEIIKIQDGMYFLVETIEKGKALLSDYFASEKELSLAAFRDILNTSRKYALPLIEHYDRIRFTKRIGDTRVKI